MKRERDRGTETFLEKNKHAARKTEGVSAAATMSVLFALK